MRVKPRIKLEILTKRWVMAVLTVTYSCIIFALVFGIFEPSLRYTLSERSGDFCEVQTRVLPGDEDIPTSRSEIGGADPTGACTTILPDGSAVWNGYIEDYHRLNGIFSAVAQLNNGTEFTMTNSTTIFIDIMVWGRENADTEWILLRNFTEVKTPVYCLRGRKQCNDVVILSEWNTECLTCQLSFERTIYQEYRLRATYPYGQTLHDFADNVSYRFVYNSLAFREGEIVFRTFFLIATIAVLAVWLISLRHFPWISWLPEQRWVTFMLCALILYQNPLFVPMLYMVGQVLQFFATLCNFTALCAMLLFWLVLIDGLRTRNHDWKEFYLPKILWGVALWLSQFCVSLTTLLLSGAKNRDNVKSYDTLSQVASYTMLSLYALWGVLFFYYVWRTAKILRLLPYLSTRFQQLSFRFFIFQAGMVIIFLGFNLIFSFATPSSWHRGMFFATLNGLKSSSADRDSSPNEHSYGAHLLVTIYIYVLAFIYLPPNKNIVQGMEGDKAKGSSSTYEKLTEDDEDRGSQFSIPTAIWLFDFAWHVYYDPPGHKTESSFGPLDTEEVGFKVLDFISNEETEICCLVAIQHGKVVVAFRGSASRKNWVYNTKVRRERVDFSERHSLFSWHTVLNNIPGKNLVTHPRIHSGFWTAYNSVYERVTESVLKGLEIADEKSSIYVTGHSLGGALATLAALDFTTQLGLDVTLYNYGSPRVADYNFSFVYNKLVPKTFRVVCDGDVVTGMPKMLLLYKHVGHEVVIDLQGNVIVDPTFVEAIFRTSARNRIKAHLMESYKIGLHMANAAMQAEARDLGLSPPTSPLIEPLQSPTLTTGGASSEPEPGTLSLPGPAVVVDAGPGQMAAGTTDTVLSTDSAQAVVCETHHAEGGVEGHQPGFDIAQSAARAADQNPVQSAVLAAGTMLGITETNAQKRKRKGKQRFHTDHV